MRGCSLSNACKSKVRWEPEDLARLAIFGLPAGIFCDLPRGHDGPHRMKIGSGDLPGAGTVIWSFEPSNV